MALQLSRGPWCTIYLCTNHTSSILRRPRPAISVTLPLRVQYTTSLTLFIPDQSRVHKGRGLSSDHILHAGYDHWRQSRKFIFGLNVTQCKPASGWESTIKTVLVKLAKSHDATSIIRNRKNLACMPGIPIFNLKNAKQNLCY